MTSFSWLHLTDFHQGMTDQNWLWPSVRQTFFNDLEQLHKQCGPWDLVLFSGDITQRGDATEFNRADQVIEDLWAHLKKFGSTPQLLAVPGNHDLARPDPDSPVVWALTNWSTSLPNQQKNAFWNKPQSEYRQVVDAAFAPYTDWWKNQPHRPEHVSSGLLPGDFAFTLEKDNVKLGIIGLNTAFLQLRAGDYQGKLALHTLQLQAACQNAGYTDGPAWAQDHHACLLLTHHPDEWLDPASQVHLNEHIAPPGRFAAHLCGHMHDPRYKGTTLGGGTPRRVWQGSSLFSLENFGEHTELAPPDGMVRVHGYAAGRIDFDSSGGRLRFWPRTVLRRQGGEREFDADRTYTLAKGHDHTKPEKFSLHRNLEAVAKPAAAGDRLGSYTLAQPLWSDRYAQTFWATSDAGSHLVQVLADEWQSLPDLGAKLEATVKRLLEAGLGQGHLIPNRHEWVEQAAPTKAKARRAAPQQWHILVYDRPAGETGADWQSLVAQMFGPGHLDQVMLLGALISLGLAELHSHKIMHGNLGPGNIVLRRHQQEGVKAYPVIKDVWAHSVLPMRTTDPRYAAPREPERGESADRLKNDCWGLGVILFELATGRLFEPAPSDAPAGGVSLRAILGDAVPEALDRVVRECLMPAAAVRPRADFVAKRLQLALDFGGTYVTDFDQELDNRLQAGYRLFAVLVEDLQELRRALAGLAARPRGGTIYHLFEAEENFGVKDVRSGACLLPWVDASQIHQEWLSQSSTAGSPTTEDVIAVNGARLWDWVVTGCVSPAGETAVLLVSGTEWWRTGLVDDQLATERALKLCREVRRGLPAVIVADSYIEISADLARLFWYLPFPPCTPSELFELILSAPERLNVPRISADLAIDLAQQLHPAWVRDISDALRLCALQYGVIDQRVVEVRDVQRAQVFQQWGLTYLPVARLPQREWAGLPANLETVVEQWSNAILEGDAAPCRLMLAGPSGYGKTFIAQALASLIRRPVVRIDVGRYLRSRLGESEELLRNVLLAASSLGGVVVLLDNIDQFLDNAAAGQGATLARLSGLFLQWLDALPPGVIAIITGRQLAGLPDQWRRRIELPLPLDQPDLDLPGDESVGYRRAIFAALFTKFGLAELARDDDDLLQALARETHPALRDRPLPSPAARKAGGPTLQNQTARLRTGADIESWIVETIELHSSPAHPDLPRTPEFWREAIR